MERIPLDNDRQTLATLWPAVNQYVERYQEIDKYADIAHNVDDN